jgi:ABC-2 type transport system permease protein
MTAAFVIWHKHMRKTLLHQEEVWGMLIQPVLWVVLFGLGMKGVMSAAMPGAGDAYIASIVPGIVALSALGGAVTGGSTWLMERLRGILKEYLAAPIPRSGILLGNALSTVTKSLFQAIVIFLVGILMGVGVTASPLGWLGGFVLVAGFCLGFSGIALAFASMTDSTGAYHSMIMLLNLPLLFLSDALYPLSLLPAWMRVCARINPTTYVIDGVRAMVLDAGAMASEGAPLWLCFLVIGVFAFGGMALAYRAFRKAVA